MMYSANETLASLNYRVRRDLNTQGVFRTENHIFRYEDMALTVYKETAEKGNYIHSLVSIQGVSSKSDAADFVVSFLKKL